MLKAVQIDCPTENTKGMLTKLKKYKLLKRNLTAIASQQISIICVNNSNGTTHANLK